MNAVKPFVWPRRAAVAKRLNLRIMTALKRIVLCALTSDRWWCLLCGACDQERRCTARFSGRDAC